MQIIRKITIKPNALNADLALLAVTAVWGTTFTVVKNALSDIGPLWFIGIRFTMAAMFLLALYPRRVYSALPRLGKVSGVIGIILFAAFMLQTTGLQYTTVSNSAFITGLSVVLAPLVGLGWGYKSPRPATWAGIACAVCGLGLLTMGENLALNAGDILTLAAALALAFHIVLVGYYAPKSDAVSLAALQIAVVAVAGLAGGILFEPLPVRFSREVWIAFAITAIPATALALLVQNTVQRYTTPTRTALIFATEPVFASLFACFILGDVLTIQQWGGCALIVAGMVASELGG